jgi:hypothetical protein
MGGAGDGFMAVTGRYKIVGFDGLPVKGAIGRKPALIHDSEMDEYAAIAAGKPPRWVKRDFILDAVQRGLVTLFARPLGLWDAETCVGYTDLHHLETRWGGMMLQPIEACSMPLGSSSWVWQEPIADAIKRLDGWARTFLNSAESYLQTWGEQPAEGRLLLAVADVNRARFCVAAIGPAAASLRRRAAVLLAAAYLQQGRFEDERLWRDLAFDFEPHEIRRIKSEATSLKRSPPLPRSRWISGDDERKIEQPCI